MQIKTPSMRTVGLSKEGPKTPIPPAAAARKMDGADGIDAAGVREVVRVHKVKFTGLTQNSQVDPEV